MKRLLKISVILATLWMASSEASTLRATELANQDWKKLLAGGEELVVEFRRGDEIPFNFTAEGDFLETTRPATSYVGVKRDFWLKLHGNDVLASVDGDHFRPLKDVAEGQLTANAGATEIGTPVNALNLVLSAKSKMK